MAERLKRLDSLRLFAIITIIISHLEFIKDSVIGEFYCKHLQNATWGVDFFFMLSGFGLYYSYMNKEINRSLSDCYSFAVEKIKKIYPLYIISLIISLPCVLFLLSTGSLKTNAFRFLLDLTLFQSLFGTTFLSHGINGVCWFLSSLFICYMVSPLLLYLIKKHITSIRKCFLFITITIVVLLIFSTLFWNVEEYFSKRLLYKGIPIIDDLAYGSPYIRIFYVLIGMLLANLYFYYNNVLKNSTLVEFVIIGLSLFYFFSRNTLSCISIILLRFLDVVNAASVLFIFALGKGELSKKVEKSQLLYSCGGGIVCIYSCYTIQ